MKEEIRNILLDKGALAVGFARAGNINPDVNSDFINWIKEGNHADMDYLIRHIPLRYSTENVLKDSKTVISLAFSYYPDEFLSDNYPAIAAYAYYEDYHLGLKKILRPSVEILKKKYGGEWRICVDSAPLSERYWALKSGIGMRGLNGNVIIDGEGSFCFLVEILTTLEIESDKPSEKWCDKCGECMKKCPGKALKGDGTMVASRCINYLTIEKRGVFSKDEIELITAKKGFLYGCDICLKVCPHNQHNNHPRKHVLTLNENILNLSPQEILSLDSSGFKKRFKDSPLLYAGFARLFRNANAIKNKSIGNPRCPID